MKTRTIDRPIDRTAIPVTDAWTILEAEDEAFWDEVDREMAERERSQTPEAAKGDRPEVDKSDRSAALDAKATQALSERPIRVHVPGRVWIVPSRTSGREYKVWRNGERLGCNCPATRTCWHIREVQRLAMAERCEHDPFETETLQDDRRASETANARKDKQNEGKAAERASFADVMSFWDDFKPINWDWPRL